MDFSKLLINPNRLTKLFVKNSHGIGEKELARIDALLSKESEKGLTDKEYIRLDKLQEKKRHSQPHLVATGAQTYLLFIYCLRKYGESAKLFTKGYMEPSASNGILKENYAVDLIKKVSGTQLYRSKVTIKNTHLRGVPDAFDNPDWEQSLLVHEIKTTHNQLRFLAKKRYPLNIHNYLQAQGYLALTGKEEAAIHYCLVDYPESIIEEQKSALFEYLCPEGYETATFSEEWAKMEDKLRFRHIPDKERIFTCYIDRDERIINKIYKKVEDSRLWLNDFAAFNEQKENHKICQAQKNSFLILLRKLGFE